MKRTILLGAASLLAAGIATAHLSPASAAFPDVVVQPPAPPAGPIPIPYPNTRALAPQSSSAFRGFARAETATGGVVQVVDVVIE